MWTPRRVLLLILGMVVFATGFGVYARFLGWIDGLPELPDELLERRAETDPVEPPAYSPVEARLQQAFGAGSAEIRYSYKIQMPAKGIVMAFDGFGIDPEGRVKLWPFSLATFKERPGQYPEINTVHADAANLEFDRPVKVLAEIGERRIVGCQLDSDPQALSADPRRGRIVVINNRATPEADDDLVLDTPGPVFYREAAQPDLPLEKSRPQLWTAAVVNMIDRRHQPDSTTINAQGMQIFLAVEKPDKPEPARKPRPRGSAVTGVRRVILPSNVQMNLWDDVKDGFLAGPGKLPAAPPAAKPVERNHVRITTPGRFVYDVLPDGDRATFERLPPAATTLPNCVRVVRPLARGPGVELNDQLECDVLELDFALKSNAPGPQPVKAAAASPARPEERQSIRRAHAWGQFIVLTSDAEKLEAHGNDLVYEARTKGTTLRGLPEMVAVKDGHEIHAAEITMYGADDRQERRAESHGPGHFRLVDRAGTRRTVEARWRDGMSFRPDAGHDLLTLTGDAIFEDRANNQMLRGDLLKLWITQDQKASAGPATAAVGPKRPGGEDATEPKVRPQRLEATGHVAVRTAEITGHDVEQLVLLFRDAPPVKSAAPPAPTSPWTTPVAAAPAQTGSRPAGAPAPTPPKKPIDLSARTIQAFVVRRGEVNDLDMVHCEDNVRVHQDPVPPQERPVDMRGRTLELKHTAEGNVLTVKGPIDRPGEVHLPDLSLIGPYIVIDQVENVAEVQGLGSMRMISTTDFDGKKLARPTPLTVTWKQGMRFTGKQAVFRGAIQADQEHTTLLCQTMQVDLNRPVSLSQKGGDPRTAGADPATVDKVICDAGPDRPQGVIIVDIIRENGRLVSARRVEADEVAVYKEEGRMDAANHGTNRGNVRIVQLGTKQDSAIPPKPGTKRPSAPGPTQPAEMEYKATLVRYAGTMKANNQTRTVQFFDGVEVLHAPVENPDQQIPFDDTVNKLPAGVLYLRSDRMSVYSAKDANGQTRQEMVASGRANVTIGDQFFGSADVIKVDEAKQLVTLEGSNGRPARARKLTPGGNSGGEFIGRKMTYNRRDDTIDIEGGYSGSSR